MISYNRIAREKILDRLQVNPIVAILGPRQCGKTTLSKQFLALFPQSTYIDLENPEESSKLTDPLAYLRLNKEKLIIIDEIQLQPNLFPLLRSFVDECNRSCKLLILGSASRELIKQGAESLAGRISFYELTPLLIEEATGNTIPEQLARGGFPLSLLATSDSNSYLWRADYLRALVERDLPLLGLRLAPQEIRRLLQMLAHSHGETLNAQKLGNSLNITGKTVKNYLSYLEGAFIIKQLPPYAINLKKRLVKSPKVYIRDTGLLHTLLQIADYEELLGHPSIGNSWEGFAIEQITAAVGIEWSASFYRTQVGAEIDLILERGTTRIAIECKASATPSVSRGFWSSVEDLQILEGHRWIVCPINEQYPYKDGVNVGGIQEIIRTIKSL